MNTLSLNSANLKKELKALSTPERAKASMWYFKTEKGQYGYGDVFFGVSVPDQRKLAKKYSGLPLTELKKLFQDKVHECRLTTLFILVDQYRKADIQERKKIVQFYLKNKKYVNNWDLVDSSAPYILGNFLADKPKDALYKMAGSKNVWDRRIAIMSTQAFIRENNFTETIKLSRILLHDTHDLIHKAVGWMLREVGERSIITEKQFLEKFAPEMPRTMLRYAIEKFPEKERKRFLSMK